MGEVLAFPRQELCQVVEIDGECVRVDVYSEDQGWCLEIVDQYYNCTCWDVTFSNAQDAMYCGLTTIQREGIQTFISRPVDLR